MRGLVSVDRALAAKPFEPIVRERVIERLAAAATYRVVLVSAPAGFGKTVAVRQYLERYAVPHVRFALRREHADLLGFVRGLLEALGPIVGDAARVLLPTYERAQRGDGLVTQLVDWLAALLGAHEGTIVIDDMHVAGSEPNVVRLLVETIERRGDGIRWIIGTRESHALPVSTWLAYGRLDMPVDEVDLRFTIGEAGSAARASGVRMQTRDVETLLELTDGWPTAFVFALRASGRTDDRARLHAGTREMIYGYLAEQVYDGLCEQDRRFLMRAALLTVLDVRALEAHGWIDVAAIVDRLCRQTSFIVLETGGVYRFHELFRAFLVDRLRRSGTVTYLAVNREAADVLEARGDFAEALRLYIDASAQDDIARIVREHGVALLDGGEIVVLERALATMDATRRESDVRIVGIAASVLAFAGEYERSDRLFGLARSRAATEDHRAEVAFRHAVTFLQRMEVDSALEVMESVVPEAIVTDRLRARFFASQATSVAFDGQHARAASLIERALDLALACDDSFIAALVHQHAAGVALIGNRMGAARELAERSMKLAELTKAYGIAARSGSIAYSVAYEVGDQSEAMRRIAELRWNAERAGDRSLLHFADLGAYDLAAERGDVARLSEIERGFRSHVDAESGRRLSEALLPAIALQAAWVGDFGRAFEIVSPTIGDQRSPDRTSLRMSETAIYAAASARRESCELLVKDLASRFAGADHAHLTSVRVVKARLLYALTLVLMQRSSTANSALRELEDHATTMPPHLQAFTSTIRAVFVHVQTGCDYDGIAAGLSSMRASGSGGFAALLEALPLTAPTAEAAPGALTQMEMRVLRALARGGTSREIAGELKRSVNTVDSHVKAIVRKLHSHGRRDAVAIARERGLV